MPGIRMRSAIVFCLGTVISVSSLSGQNSAVNPVQEHIAKAEAALRANDLAGAEREYREILSADPQNSAAWTGLGILLYGSGREEMAVESLQRALKLDPGAERAESFLGLSEAELRNCAQAVPILTKYFSRPSMTKVRRLTGLALLGCTETESNPSQAIQVALQLKQLYPGDPDILYELAELYTRLWNEAAGELIAEHPESYRVHQLAGEVNEAQNNFDQAIREYSLALQDNPRLPQMHYRIGQLYLRKAAPDADDKAMEEFRAEKQVNPNSAVCDLAMADIDVHLRKLDEAKLLYQEAAHLDPTLVEAQVGLAKLLLDSHQTDAAVRELQGVIASHPDAASAHYTLMLAYRQQKRISDAVAEMAIFNQLQTARQNKFQSKLSALLNAQSSSSATPSK